jgi:P-type Mg2+ transporter
MACSSNFGNMFSATVAVLYLPFLPMLPLQIILNNFIYDFSQITIPTDNVDDEWTKKPRKWNINFIKKYMMVFGPISSVFDIALFVILYGVYHVDGPTLQTAWFMFSLATQTMGIFIIRTRHTPFVKSFPSMSLFMSSIMCLVAGWVLPYIPLGMVFKFTPLDAHIVWTVVGVQIAYLVALEIVKKWFYKKYEY